MDGKGVPEDRTVAAKWYRVAADQGHADAQHGLSNCYWLGWGVTQDYAEAARWNRKAAEQGHTDAQLSLGISYAVGKGVSQDYSEAVKWYLKAAEQANAEAQNRLACCYWHGRGVLKDSAVALKWFRKAAEQGLAVAQYSLGVCYENSQGTEQDCVKAAKWFCKAAEQGVSEAQRRIAACYYYGIGIERDFVESEKWYRKAADQGDVEAEKWLGKLRTMNTGAVSKIPLTLARAHAIVEHAENEYATGRRIEYSFTPFEAGGASSPLEALHALFIVIADRFWFTCARQSGTPAAVKMFDGYAASSTFIAMSLAHESTKIHSIAKLLNPEMIASITAFETVDSFVSYLRTLSPASAYFWPQVYQRLDLEYPIEPALPQKTDVAPVVKKPWWRFW